MANVFISYSKTDAAWARRVSDALTARGLTVWWDTEGLSAGEEFAAEIERELDAADAVLVLWSATSARSEWVRDEADHGKRHGKLVSAIIDDLALPPLGFRQRHAVSIREWGGDAYDPAIAAVLESVAAYAKVKLTPPPMIAPAEPFASPQPASAPAPMAASLDLRPEPGPRLLVALAVAPLALLRLDMALASFGSTQGDFGANVWIVECFFAFALCVLAAGMALAAPRLTTWFIGAGLALSAGLMFDNAVFTILEDANQTANFELIGAAHAMPLPVEAAESEDLAQARSNANATASFLAGLAMTGLGLMLVSMWRRGSARAWFALVGACCAAAIFEAMGLKEYSTAWFQGLPALAMILMQLPAILLCGAAAYFFARKRFIA